jgi:signal transduction histidine kinase/ActR/RegA family two-component response regulator
VTPVDAEPLAQRALQRAPFGLLSFGDDGTIRYANPCLHAWLDASVGELADRHIDHVLAPASRVFYSTHLFPLLKLHGRADEVHLILRTAAGKDLPVLVSAVRDADGDGMPLNHCGVLTMARRKELELALVDARRAAEVATAAKDQFLAVVSHELRSPLSAITGWVRLAKSGKLDATMQQRALDTIERNAQLQGQLIEDLLDVSRIVSGKLRISPRPIDLAPIVEAGVDTSRPMAQAKGVDLVMSLDDAAGIVDADPARVQQIVWNLVSNAVKFTPRGGRVQVGLSNEGSRVRLQVADSGAGIDPAQLPYVFERFWQTDAAMRHELSGLGLGLSICKSLVELHGGSIRAESAGPGQGAVFIVEFPLAVAAAGTRGGAVGKPRHVRRPFLPPDADTDAAPLRDIRVLVVDDDADARDLLKMLLEGVGAVVQTAAGADEAMGRIREAPPQVVVSDIGMPGKDGYEFIRQLRADRTLATDGIAAIAVTGLARPQDRVNMLRAGFQAHLLKPLEPTEVIALVRALARH